MVSQHNKHVVKQSLLISCYDHRTFTVTVVVGYHRANTATAVFSIVLGSLSGRCFLKTAHQYSAEQFAAIVI